MDLSTIIIGVVCFGICILPFALITINRKKREQLKLNALRTFASQYECSITMHELCGDLVIGIDADKKALFLFNESASDIREHFIDLNEVKNCSIIKTSKEMQLGNVKHVILDRLELNFEKKSGKGENWEFFDSIKNIQLVGELQLIEVWQKLVLSKIKE